MKMWFVNNCFKPIHVVFKSVPVTIWQDDTETETTINYGIAIPNTPQPIKIELIDTQMCQGPICSNTRLSEATSCIIAVPDKNGGAGKEMNVPIKNKAAYRARYEKDAIVVEELKKDTVQLAFRNIIFDDLD